MNIEPAELAGKKVFVTGGFGFLGKYVVKQLENFGALVWTAPHGILPLNGMDFLNKKDCDIAVRDADYVFHLAGHNFGIKGNIESPADIFYQNSVMGLQIIDSCYRLGVKKLVSVVASCAYNPGPYWMGEEKGFEEGYCDEPDFLNGTPHESVEGHGYAKRNIQIASLLYKRQHGCNFVTACPTTLYGPGDKFGPDSKVLGSLVRRFVDAKDENAQSVTCWGTGKPRREFLYVEDCAKLLVGVLCKYNESRYPINLGTGHEFSIKELATLVAQRVGFSGEIIWDISKPDGEFRKLLVCDTAKELFPNFVPTSIETGIDATIAAYRKLKS